MQSTRKLVALLAVVLAVLALGPAPGARAHNDHPRVVPPLAYPYAGAGVFVATLLVGPATVACAAPSSGAAGAATNTAGPAINVGSDPQGLAITPNGKSAYVANYDDDTATPSTYSLLLNRPAFDRPHGWAVADRSRRSSAANATRQLTAPINWGTAAGNSRTA